jgi:phenylpropionate dioxygenase-like ring-hydroxylating dioxygenase large terminal subunit
MKLRSGWYAWASLKELSKTQPRALRRMGENWVVWWSSQSQSWVAQRDRCPHRGARLSLGTVRDGRIQCPFHGLEFDSAGECAWVPEIGRNAPGMSLKTLRLIERADFICAPWGQPTETEIPWFAELEDKEWTYGSYTRLWAQHFSRCVENQLDYAHLPYVHANSIGRGFDLKRQRTFEFSDQGIRVLFGDESTQEGYFEFRYPNVWRLWISRLMVQTLMFVPVDDSQTLIYSRSYHRFTQIPWIRDWIAWFSAKVVNPYILAQDQRVVLGQEPGDVTASDEEFLLPSDRAIGAFRKWLKAQE